MSATRVWRSEGKPPLARATPTPIAAGTRKVQCQLAAWTSVVLTQVPTIAARPDDRVRMPTPHARRGPRYTLATSARHVPKSRAEPTPWTARAAISRLKSPASAASSAPAANVRQPARNSLPWPKASPSRPAIKAPPTSSTK
jgi:hypothetical protein